jgi:hypothetical protein
MIFNSLSHCYSRKKMKNLLLDKFGVTPGENGRSHEELTTDKQACSAQDSGASTTNATLTVAGILELIKNDKARAEYKTYRYPIEAQDEDRVKELLVRSMKMRDPMAGLPLPTRPEPYGTTVELFIRIKQTIAERTGLAERASALLTFWIFSTWCQEALWLAPCLVITASPYEGEVVLRTLRSFCYHPLPTAGMNSANLNAINWLLNPTLLISEPNLGKRMAALLGHSTTQGYTVIASERNDLDYFGPKAIFVGGNLQTEWALRHCIHLNAIPISKVESNNASPLSEETTLGFQNKLLQYRLGNLARVRRLDFDATCLSHEASAIANALGNCIIDAPALQAELVSLLKPLAGQQLADRSESLEAVAIEAALALCHKGKDQVFVREIASEVNLLQQAHGEKLLFTPEAVGHKLKKLGLFTRRLGQGGKGLVMDNATKTLLHEVAIAYLGKDSIQVNGNLHCPLCPQNQ